MTGPTVCSRGSDAHGSHSVAQKCAGGMSAIWELILTGRSDPAGVYVGNGASAKTGQRCRHS